MMKCTKFPVQEKKTRNFRYSLSLRGTKASLTCSDVALEGSAFDVENQMLTELCICAGIQYQDIFL